MRLLKRNWGVADMLSSCAPLLMLFIIFVSIGIDNVIAQSHINLVPNPGFENKINCPTELDKTSLLYDWYNATDGNTPDYYYFDDDNGCTKDPFHAASRCSNLYYLGGFEAHNGKGYVGLVTHAYSEGSTGIDIDGNPISLCTSHNKDEEDEKVGVKLSRRLRAGETIYASMWVKHSGMSSGLYTPNIGMLFTANKITTPSDFNGLSAQIIGNDPESTNYFNIDDESITWFQVSGTFTAVGNEEYLTIGAFDQSKDANGHYFVGGGSNGDVYYYFDDVQVGNPPCCPEYRLYENISGNYLPSLTMVSDYIKAGKGVSGYPPGTPDGNVVVSSGRTVVFQAGGNIDAGPGFIVEPGAEFIMRTAGCNPNIAYDEPTIEFDYPGDGGSVMPETIFSACCDGSHSLWVIIPKATEYHFRMFSESGAKVADQQGVVLTDKVVVWKGLDLNGYCYNIPGVYAYEIDLWSCFGYALKKGSITVVDCSNKSDTLERGSQVNENYIITDDATILLVDTPKIIDNSISIYPNPFGNSTKIFVGLSKQSKVDIQVYDLLGHILNHAIDNNTVDVGNHSYDIYTADWVQGIYNAVIIIDGKSTVKKIVKL